MKKIIFLLFCFTIIYADDTIDIGFRYGFLTKPTLDSNDITVLADSSIIHSGDRLQINIGYANGTNFCVIYKSAENEYMLLFPDVDKVVQNNNASSLDTLYLPVLHWAKMDKPPGIETFYFINSIKSLSEFVTVLNRYDKAPPKGKSKLAKRIQDKLDSVDPDVHDDLSSIASPLDKPVTGGVAFRGEDDGLKDLSVTHECLGSGGIAFQKIVLIHK